MNSENKTRIEIGEHVVYPLQGVGIIKDIRERVVHDVPVLYYVIYIDMSDMTVSIPVDKVFWCLRSLRTGIRPSARLP